MAKSSEKINLGVRGRLLLAFLGIGAFSVIAAASGFFSLSQVGGALTKITEERVPQALSLLELSRQAERVVRAAPALLQVTSHSARVKVSEEIAVQVEQLNMLVERITDSQSESPQLLIKNITSQVEKFNTNLENLSKIVQQRLSAASIRKEKIKLLTRIHGTSLRLVSPGLKLLDSQTSNWNRNQISSGENPLTEKQTKLARSIVELVPQQKATALVDAVSNGLLAIAAVDSVSKIDVLIFPLIKSFKKLIEITEIMPARVKKRLEKQVAILSTLVEGEASIAETRKNELEIVERAKSLLVINEQRTTQLTKEVSWLVKKANEEIEVARSNANSIQVLNQNILIGVLILGFVSSILIVWLYVSRNLIARLTGLSNSMLAIANGNLRATLPKSSGNDEISEMAKALIVFRDTAIEVEESNLAEIEEARRRLTDAIENTSEGFAFYDENDKLVICNERYRELLYPDQDLKIEPGMNFEDIIRQSAELGNIAEAGESIDEWVERRLKTHRNPGEPQLQERGDGRWILVSERKTGDNGTVAIYSDITDLKQREKDLAEKSNTLEQLSKQLAKYLSPQVYDSIFSGKQEVKLISERKRLTIFFSDIAGFTATTEKLESEDLTQLLNHYLTEMSNIALEYGATIDKYIGDAIVIFFGDPETLGVKEDAMACVKMAIAMRKRMLELQNVWDDAGVENPLKCRMGINTGMCTVGNFGSDDRMDYTIIGGGVNLAARLEGACNTEQILISYETFAHVRDEIYCEPLEEIVVKGISQPVATYQVVDLYENIDDKNKPIRTKLPHFQLNIDVPSMTKQEQKAAAAALLEAAENLGHPKAKKK